MVCQVSRGGAKPQMMPTGTDVLVSMNGGRKGGMYELSGKRDTLARRVELPAWLSEVVKRSRNSLDACIDAQYPAGDIAESRGHIFMRPPRHLFSCPAVGLDMEVYDRLLNTPSIQEIKFYIYATGYELVGLWSISADEFIDQAKMVQTKPQFMPQMMVPLTALSNRYVPTLH